MNRPLKSAATGHVRPNAPSLDCGEPLARVGHRMAELAGDRRADPGARMLHDHLATGGKQLRARLALATCEALGGTAEDAVDWAAAVELLHNATLVHDDIQDGDRVRRGQPALWARYGAAQAINAGDLLLMLPFVALGRYPSDLQSALVQVLATYAEATARGQIRELALNGLADDGWRDYLAASSGKTGTLFALPVRGSAAIAGVEGTLADALGAAFASIGVLYQLQDDLLDVFDEKARDGEASDLYEGRLTALVLAHFDLYPGERETLLAFLARPRDDKNGADVARWKERLTHGGAAQHLLFRIDSLAAELLGSESLASTPALHRVADDLVARVLEPLQAVRPSTRRRVQA
ncbi:MAG: polyprenyl synthetase family protein [Myxococcota bacterium]